MSTPGYNPLTKAFDEAKTFRIIIDDPPAGGIAGWTFALHVYSGPTDKTPELTKTTGISVVDSSGTVEVAFTITETADFDIGIYPYRLVKTPENVPISFGPLAITNVAPGGTDGSVGGLSAPENSRINWLRITNTPTTLAGYGITDGATGTGDALRSSNLDQFLDVTQTTGKTLAITDNTTLAGGLLSGTNTGDQTNISGNAATVSVIDAGADATCWFLFANQQTGNQSPATNANATFNAATGAVALGGNLTVGTSGAPKVLQLDNTLFLKAAGNNRGFFGDSGAWETNADANLAIAAYTTSLKLYGGGSTTAGIVLSSTGAALTGVPTAPTASPGTNTQQIATCAFVIANTGVPTAITVANEATDATCFLAFFTAATGDLGPKTNANLTFNSATGAMAFGGTISSTGGQTDSERFGAGTTVAGISSVVIGKSASAIANDVVIGASASSSVGTSVVIGNTANGVQNSVSIGWGASATGIYGIAIGRQSLAGGSSLAVGHGSSAASAGGSDVVLGDAATVSVSGAGGSVVIGANASDNTGHSIALGYGATTTAGNQLVFGSSVVPINEIIFPSGSPNFKSQKVIFRVPTTASASANLPAGTAPTSPVDGDIWYDGTHFYGRVAGVTKQLDN